jgi:molybdenum cofactor synthesis domain-containing protein
MKMISPDKALELVLEGAEEIECAALPLNQSLGKVLAEPIFSDRDYPPFNRAMMDGFAVKLCDAGKAVHVIGTIAAGQDSDLEVREGSAVEIMTGASCPCGTEAVVKYEICQRQRDRVHLPPDLRWGSNVAGRGNECRRSTQIMEPGQEITELRMAVLAAFGHAKVTVYPKPSMAIIVTGDELDEFAGATASRKVRDSNGPMVLAMAKNLGLEALQMFKASDSSRELLKVLREASEADIVVLTGGVSAGKFDLVPETLESFGVELIFHKVTQKPGKPMLYGRKGRQPFFGLPGNPLACHLCFNRYIAPASMKMSGSSVEPIAGHGFLSDAVSAKGNRTLFQLVRVSHEDDCPDSPTVTPLVGKGSADLFAPVSANAYIRVSPHAAIAKVGDEVEFEYIRGRRAAVPVRSVTAQFD